MKAPYPGKGRLAKASKCQEEMVSSLDGLGTKTRRNEQKWFTEGGGGCLLKHNTMRIGRFLPIHSAQGGGGGGSSVKDSVPQHVLEDFAITRKP